MSLADSWAALQMVEAALKQLAAFSPAYPTVESRKAELEKARTLNRQADLIRKKLHGEYSAYMAQLEWEAPHDR